MVKIVIASVLTIWIVVEEFFRLKNREAGEKTTAHAFNEKYFFHKLVAFLSDTIFSVLLIALVWTIYFLILVVTQHEKAQYAMDVTNVITGVITVFSVLIAFYEFRKNK